MRAVNKQINKLLQKAEDIAISEVERIVTSILKNNSNLGGFFMGMGTYCFEDLNYQNDNSYENRRLDDFIMEWDSVLRITGHAICLRKDKQGNIFKTTCW